MKNLYKALSFACYLLANTSAHAMLPFSAESVTIKNKKTLHLLPATTEDQRDAALHLIKKRFSTANHTEEYQEVCAYFMTPKGNKLVGAANLLYPTKTRLYASITNMVVRRKYQNEGIGSALLEYIIRNAPCPLQLFSINEDTTRLYKRHDFYSYEPLIPGKMKRDYKAEIL